MHRKIINSVALLLAITCFGQSEGMSVLIIGDSNTEHGFIPLALADTLRNHFRGTSSGTGYIPLNSSFYKIRDKRVSDVTIAYPKTWKLLDMFEGSRLKAKPFLSPSGHWLRSESVNAPATVGFPGNGVDIYWLAQKNGGKFSVTIDKAEQCTVSTAGPTGVRKTSITNLNTGKHTLELKVTSIPSSGSVILLGFDARNDIAGHPGRAVVHNWGNGYASTSDFLAIDSVVFATGLQKLAPDIVVVLLGTNDHLQDSRGAAALKTNLKALLNRIKAAEFTGRILLVSTFMTDNKSGRTFVPQYRKTSWPEAASETGVAYWDMSTWYGAPDSRWMSNGNHCNQAGGKKIGFEMFRQILDKFPETTKKQGSIRAALRPNPWYANGQIRVPWPYASSCLVELFDLHGRRIGASIEEPGAHGILSFFAPNLGSTIYTVSAKSSNHRLSWRVSVVW